jgi:hypothetical protein
MKNYKVFEKNGHKVAVKQGWSWPGFFLSWIWAFNKKLLLHGVICLATNVIFAAIPVKNIMSPYFLVSGILFGLKGNKWREEQLLKSGYCLAGTVQAKSPAEATSGNF